jgi:NhaA family Na+:H+ antiporter
MVSALAERLLRRLDRFLAVEAASGVVLLAAAALAVGWASSPWSGGYERLWRLPFEPHLTLRALIDDGLMTLFFLVAGLEIRDELHEGTLAHRKSAILPVAAALGGMLAPALLFAAFNGHGEAARGWGVPMATDIAFAVGVLALAGKRVPSALRLFLLALAIIDDLGAIVVIALFYSQALSWLGLGLAAGGVLGVLALRRLRVGHPLVYLAPGAIVWWGFHLAGIHPTIAGVVLGLLMPATASGPVQTALHPWVAYAIMPLFALANAGVDLRHWSWHDPGAATLFGGVLVGLVAGKPLGILAACWVTIRLGWGVLPPGLSWRGLAIAGVIAGIGFTMAIFIAGLAFGDDPLLGTAKAAVLLSSLVAGGLGLGLAMLLLPRPGGAGAGAAGAGAGAGAVRAESGPG